MLIPSTVAGSIIGKGGQTIAQLQKDTKTVIKLSKNNDFYPGKIYRLRQSLNKMPLLTLSMLNATRCHKCKELLRLVALSREQTNLCSSWRILSNL